MLSKTVEISNIIGDAVSNRPLHAASPDAYRLF